MLRWFPRLAVSLALSILVAGGAWAAIEESTILRLKRLQQQILLSEPAEKLERMERLDDQYRKARRTKGRTSAKASRSGRAQTGHGAGQRRRPELAVTDVPRPRLERIRSAAKAAGLSATTDTPANRLMNDISGEPWGACQSEVSIAAVDSHVVATWNDGIGIYGFPTSPTDDTQGYAYSPDSGLTWVDGGPVPNGGLFLWSSDPVVVVNRNTGAFYYCALIDNPGAAQNGLAIVKGTFTGNTFTWGTPVVVRSYSNTTNLIDKQWLAVDPVSGNLYMTFSNFTISNGSVTSNSIQFTRSTNDGQTWSAPATLSASGDAGYVQGSRPAVGPSGEIYIVWHAIGIPDGYPGANSPYGRDFLRIRKSTDGGVNFGTQVTADSVFSNFGSGAPGFNRGLGITFPGIAVDQSSGPNRGRVYLTWNESLNFYNDLVIPPPAGTPARREAEPNDTPGQGTPFTPGEVLRGVVSRTGSPGDLDYWRWNATQGQTVIFYLDSMTTSPTPLDVAHRIFCSDGTTHLAFSQSTGGQTLLVFTAPTTATYYMRVASYEGERTGGYRVLTAVNAPQNDRARDQRDIFVKSSANGTSWGPTVRVNDSPGHFDDWLPEVAVDGVGRAFVADYDWRDATSTCGGGSNVYLYRSDDAGASWIPGTRLTDVTSNWSASYSTLLPNQGDYIGMTTRDSTVFVAWADVRDTDPTDGNPNVDPNVYMTTTNLSCEGAPVAVVGSSVQGDTITVTWSAPQGFQATLSRRVDAGPFVDIGTLTADPSGQIVYVDENVALGHTYTYRLQVSGFCQTFAGTVAIPVSGPTAAPFGIDLIRPNPTRHDVWVELRRTGTAPAYLELLDITGRQIHKLTVPCPAGLFCAVNVTEGISVKAGLYFVRLVEGNREAIKRVSIVSSSGSGGAPPR